MASTRKLQAEIDRTLKKVDEGVDIFNDTYDKIQTASNSNQKDKYEGELKKEIKKLQRLRDSIKTWLTSNDIKDKKILMEKRKLIETQMERFKVVERQTKTKAFSKEGLNQASKMDPKQRAKKKTQGWIQEFIDTLNQQVDAFDAEVETLSASKKKKDKGPRIDELHAKVTRHKFNIDMLERCLRSLENDTVTSQQLDDIKEEVEYYVDNNEDPDFMENEFLYEDFDLEVDHDEVAHKEDQKEEKVEEEPQLTPAEEKALKKKEKEEKKKKKEAKEAAKAAEAAAKEAAKEAAIKETAEQESTKIKKAKESKPKDSEKSPEGKSAAKDAAMPSTTDSTAAAGTGTPSIAQPKYAAAASLARGSGTAGSKSTAAPSFSNVLGQEVSIKADKAVANPVVQDTVVNSPRNVPSGVVRGAASPDDSPDAHGSAVPRGVDQTGIQPASVAAPGGTTSQPGVPPGIYDFGSSTVDMGMGDAAVVGGASTGAPAITGVGPWDSATGTSTPGAAPGMDDPLANEQTLLEASFRNKPEHGDTAKPNLYTVCSPFPVAQHYRDVPYIPLDSPHAFQKLEMDPLFFAFYYQQGTYQQYLAARELKKKSWRFHKKYRTWFQRHEDPTTITDDYEQGTYVYFDNDTSWTMRKKAEFRFDYCHLAA